MANTKFTGRSDSYIFEDAGGKRDQLEQAILNELQAKHRRKIFCWNEKK